MGLVALAAGCGDVDYGRYSFRCTSDQMCPAGYTCQTDVCVRHDVIVPTRLASTVDDGEVSFSIHPRDGHLLVCWNQSLTTRMPGVFATVMAPSADSAISGAFGITQSRVLYSGDDLLASTVLGTHGNCGVTGDNVVVGVNRVGGMDALLYRNFVFYLPDEVQSSSGIGRSLFDRLYNGAAPIGFGTAHVDDSTWFFRTEWRGNRSQSPDSIFHLEIIRDDLSVSHDLILGLAGITSDSYIRATDLVAGDGGAWVATLLPGNTVTGSVVTGVARFAWIDAGNIPPDTVLTPWIADPVVPTYLAAYPLAARGNELAAAYNLVGNQWQIFWIQPTGTTPDPTLFAPSTVRPGPVFTLGDGMLRPGATREGDALIMAVATQPDEVVAWSFPWDAGPDAVPTVVGRIPKLTQVMARRAAIARVGNDLHAVWTERIPATTTGFTEYVALFEGLARP